MGKEMEALPRLLDAREVAICVIEDDGQQGVYIVAV